MRDLSRDMGHEDESPEVIAVPNPEKTDMHRAKASITPLMENSFEQLNKVRLQDVLPYAVRCCAMRRHNTKNSTTDINNLLLGFCQSKSSKTSTPCSY